MHHAGLTPQLGRPRASRLADLSEGLSLLTIGLLKKLMLADSVAAGANAVFGAAAAGHAPNAAEAFLGVAADPRRVAARGGGLRGDRASAQ